MIVCHCKGITDREIRTAARRGAVTADLVADSCDAGGGCGGCRDHIEEIVLEETRHVQAQGSMPPGRVHLPVVTTGA